MKTARNLLLYISLTALLAVTLAQQAHAQRATVGIVPFKNAAGVDIHVANALADMLTTELVKTRKFDVVERTALSAIADEQNLGASGAVDFATAARIGKLKGADYMVIGVVTEAGKKDSSVGFRVPRFGHRISLGGGKVSLAIDVRFVDTTSGSIVFADDFRQEEKSNSINVGFFNVEEANVTGGELGRAVIRAITDRITLSTFPPKIAAYTPANREVILNYGGGAFASVTEWEVYREGDAILDPDTGEVLDRRTSVIGRIKVTRPSEKVTYCELISGDIAVGDVCRPAVGKSPSTTRTPDAAEDRSGDKKKSGGLLNRLRRKGSRK